MHWTSFPATFLAFLALSLTIPLNPFQYPSPKSSLANAQSTSSGNMTLYRDDLGFYIYAYNTPDISDNSPNSNGIPMILGLYTSKTSLMTNCLNFSSYNCSSKTCEPFQDSKAHENYPSFTAKGYEASAFLYLDYNYWSLYDFALIATSCKSNTSSNFGSSRHGIIGMGVQPNSFSNYASYVSFAVSIAPDLWSGELTFLNYSNQINREQVTQPLFTDSSWSIRFFISIVQLGNFNTTANFNIFFDLGADTIGLPHSLFESLMKYFREEVFLDCTHALSRPQCGYNGLINDLPNITIMFLQQNTTIVIPPAIYIQNASNITGIVDLVKLNLRALGQDLTGESYSGSEYENSIILDINFMSYYYVVFNFTVTGPHMTLYLNKEKDNADPKDYSIYILFGCIGFIVLMAVIYGGFRFCQKKKYSRISPTNTHEALINKDIQSVSSVHHANELQGERGE